MSETQLKSPLNTSTAGSWLRGNLHAHSTRSDGSEEQQTVIQSYADMGHDYFFLSDHDVLTDYDGLDNCGMILIPGNEVSAGGAAFAGCGGEGIGGT